MRSPTMILAAACCLTLPCASALHLHKPRDASPRVVQFDLQRNEIIDRVAHDRNRLGRRDATLNTKLENEVSPNNPVEREHPYLTRIAGAPLLPGYLARDTAAGFHSQRRYREQRLMGQRSRFRVV
jgi:hypothetical protein